MSFLSNFTLYHGIQISWYDQSKVWLIFSVKIFVNYDIKDIGKLIIDVTANRCVCCMYMDSSPWWVTCGMLFFFFLWCCLCCCSLWLDLLGQWFCKVQSNLLCLMKKFLLCVLFCRAWWTDCILTHIIITHNLQWENFLKHNRDGDTIFFKLFTPIGA